MRKYTVSDAYEYACVDSENGEVVWGTQFAEQQISELNDIIKKYKNLDFYWWAIAESTNNKVIGGILTVNANEKMLSCEIAYVINAKFRNKGYASEALKRIFDFGSRIQSHTGGAFS